ncbi:hypothetical protein ACM26W_12830 [Halomonas sp. HK25]|uniref:hypothetical protein n=1 Tax=Halomonas sp. HK25 TaxID=3394321 RepID=UPI0039FCA2FD
MSLSASTGNAGPGNVLPNSLESLPNEQWSSLWEAESVLCRWLATVVGAEIGEEALGQYRQGDAAPMLELLAAEYGLEAEVKRLEESLAGLVMFPIPHLVLAADFAELFLVDALSGAAPYASLHAGGVRVLSGSSKRGQGGLGTGHQGGGPCA